MAFNFIKMIQDALAGGGFGPLTGSVAKVGAAAGIVGGIGGSELMPDPERPSRPTGAISPSPEIEQMRQFLAPMLQQALSRYQQQGEGLLPRTGFLGRHPRFAGGLEGFLAGAALTGPSSTPGEAISNVSRAVLGIPQLQRQARQQRAEEPLNLMQSMIGLRDLETTMGLKEAQRLQLLDLIGRERYSNFKTDEAGKMWGWNARASRWEPVPTAGGEFKGRTAEDRMASGGRIGQIIDMLGSADPMVRAEGERQKAAYLQLQGLTAEERKRGALAGDPDRETPEQRRWLDQNEKSYNNLIASTQTFERAFTTFGKDASNPNRLAEIRQNVEAAYEYWKLNDSKSGVPFDLRYVQALRQRAVPRGTAPSPNQPEDDLEGQILREMLDRLKQRRGQ